MSSPNRSTPVVRIVLAAAVVIVLAALLGVRIAARAAGTQGPFAHEPGKLARMGVPLKAVVPEPAPLPAGGLPVLALRSLLFVVGVSGGAWLGSGLLRRVVMPA